VTPRFRGFALTSPRVIAGLDPAIHDEEPRAKSVRLNPLRCLMDARVKPGHDALRVDALCPDLPAARNAIACG